jgi:hypothetical protein
MTDGCVKVDEVEGVGMTDGYVKVDEVEGGEEDSWETRGRVGSDQGAQRVSLSGQGHHSEGVSTI